MDRTSVSARKATIYRTRRGFSLIITLLMMVLLTIIALGLLSLSTISLRNSGQGQAAATARANARLALQLAIGALQKEAGADQRVTANADQIASSSDGSATSAASKRRNWSGVYRSWPDTATTRPTPTFLSWLVSGTESDIRSRDFAKSTSASVENIRLVGTGSVGSLKDGEVAVPVMPVKGGTGVSSRYAWWVGDQATKAAIGTPPLTQGTDVASTRATLQAANRNAIEIASTAAGTKPFESLAANDTRLSTVTSWKQGELLGSSPTAQKPLFHDLASRSLGLLTNVRSGGFRKDLSMYLEKTQSNVPQNPLYTVNGENGINEAELWLYYNFWKELKTGSSSNYTTGGSIGRSTPYLQVEGTKAEVLTDPEYLYKQPSIISYQTILSFYSRQVAVGANTVNRLAVVVDPIVTMWNPLDVPVVVTPAYNSIKFWQLPYDVTIKRPSGNTTVSLRTILGAGNWHYMTLIAGKAQPIVMKPGEVLMLSQGPNTPVGNYNPTLNFIPAQAGWNFGGGISIDIKTTGGAYIESATNETFTYEVTPNAVTSSGSQEWSLTENDLYWGEDRAERGESLGVGGVTIDWINGKPSERIKANAFPDFFGKIKPSDTRPLTFQQVQGRKEPFMLFSYAVKTETGSDRPGRFLSRYNPKALSTDFQTLTPDELETMPFEVRIEPLSNVKKFPVSITGQSYFGGGNTAQTGNSIVTTHSIPREPLNSLASFQYSFANGFTTVAANAGYGLLETRSQMLPQVSHAIGNSMACSVIPADKTSSSLGGPRTLADHSYLANQALWDSWFLSSIAPQTATTYTTKRAQSTVALDFLKQTKPLPNSRYVPVLRGLTPEAVVAKLFSGSVPKTDAHTLTAAYLAVDGMFNVNSTSVEAWKALLAALRDKSVATRGATGTETVTPGTGIPVSSLFAPDNQIAKGAALNDVVNSAQWVGRRVLSDDEISALAQAIVKEVRKRGPFLSLADFVNRRPGSDKTLARAGAIQSALDSKEVPINSAYNTGSRATAATGPGRGFAFPEAEEGPAAYGIPGVVKQADILTPIAPYLSARSDTFLIRAYGDSVDASGNVLARAWCEAEIQRDGAFVDASEVPEKAIASVNSINKTFGRRYQIVSFRWLSPDEV